MDHQEEAVRHLKMAQERDPEQPSVLLGVAAVHAVLFLADSVRHGLRDLVYELRS